MWSVKRAKISVNWVYFVADKVEKLFPVRNFKIELFPSVFSLELGFCSIIYYISPGRKFG